MFCINCFNPNTSVTNSRPHKKTPSIWRRRHCKACGHTFTTDERPRLSHTQAVWDPKHDKTMVYNPGKLVISIALAFGHNVAKGKESAWDLMETITAILATQFQGSLSTDDITAVTHQTLKNFDEAAALQYAMQHQLLTSTKRRRKS